MNQKNMFDKKFVTIISIIIGVLVIGAIAVVSVDLTQNDNNSKIIQEDESNIDTSDWKTYTNEEFGMEFRYPGEWKIGNKGNNYVNFFTGVDTLEAGDYRIRVWRNPSQVTVKDFYNDIEESKKVKGNEGLIYNWYELSNNRKQIIVDGIPATNFISPIGIMENTAVVIPYNELIIEIVIFGVEEIIPKSIDEKILSSFKFKTKNTSNWKIYKNDKFNYTIKLPDEFKNYSEYDGSEIPFSPNAIGLNAVKDNQVINTTIEDRFVIFQGEDSESDVFEQRKLKYENRDYQVDGSNFVELLIFPNERRFMIANNKSILTIIFRNIDERVVNVVLESFSFGF